MDFPLNWLMKKISASSSQDSNTNRSKSKSKRNESPSLKKKHAKKI